MWQKIKNIYHLLEGLIANLIYNFPSRKINVIGVTGTDGKTTTTHLIYHILKEDHYPVSMISTVYAKIADKEYETGLHVTTPSSFMIQKFLYQAVKNKQKYFILETTSHALDQNRVFGVKYSIGIITNITHEHLDYHRNFDEYIKTKTKLLNQSDIAVVNTKDPVFQKIKNYITNKNLKIIDYYEKQKKIKIKSLPSSFFGNYVAAYTVSRLLNIPHQKIIAAIKTFQLPPGRLNVAFDKKFKVIIDFAHTPNAFQVILPFIKERFLKNDGRLIHIFGCAGLRDKLKRPKMGKISSQYANLIIITEEDYRTENIKMICQQIISGIDRKKFSFKTPEKIKNNENRIFTVIPDRYQAIKFAIKQAKDNDIVLLTGKGHEKSLARGKKEYPWDEKKAVVKVLKELKYI